MYSSIAIICLGGSSREKPVAIVRAGCGGVRAASRQNTADTRT